MKYQLISHHKKILADTITPVSVYLKIRDRFPNSILLESSDYHANDNSFSYICCNPIASIKVENETITKQFPDGSIEEISVGEQTDIPSILHDFGQKFDSQNNNFKFINNGLFGYMAYDAVKYFEDIDISKKNKSISIPDIYYAIYQNIVAINHFKNEAYIFAHCYESQNNIGEIEQILNAKNFASYNFSKEGSPISNLKDEEYKQHVELAKKHCNRGDVFQLVLSRRFSQEFKGDEFNVYRALRSINPSPYLFYFDYGDFKIFGSSPEAQLIVKDGKAEIHPIAGTFKRTGNDEQDAELAKKLKIDDKENSEHVMLVDLARNDLSRNGTMVKVENYREVQFFSHVIHLVSKETGLKKKNMAMQLIEKYEKTSRGYYGGAIGFMDFNGNFNHAIMIRTFLSKNHQLHYQAGAGLVAASNPENELQETYNKLGALTKALEIAETI